ncbi:MAG: hypothetical protein WC526_02290 [Patescibacteria group bacterium]
MQQAKAKYKGSAQTFALVKEQILERFGQEAADSYRPTENCFTLRDWNSRGFRVRKSEKAIRSFTIVEEENEQEEKRRWRKPVFLFWRGQVEEIKSP